MAQSGGIRWRFGGLKGEAWWARQDSNLQPDRYERPALTIELQAPPRTAAWDTRPATVRAPLNTPTGDPAMPGFGLAGAQRKRRRTDTAPQNKNIENNPMHSSHVVAGISIFGYPEK